MKFYAKSFVDPCIMFSLETWKVIELRQYFSVGVIERVTFSLS